MPKKEIILIGGGGHCLSVIDVIELEGKYQIAGIVDLPENINKKILNYPIIADDSANIHLTKQFQYFLITIGFIKSPHKRIHLFNQLDSLGATFPSIISPLSYVSKHANIGEGSVVMHNSQVNANARIGNNCIVNSKALIEHDSKIGDNCHISTGAIINGDVGVGDECFIGSGSIVIQGNIIPKGTFLKAGKIYNQKG